MIDDRRLVREFRHAPEVDLPAQRSIDHWHALRLFESAGVPYVNSYRVAQICGDKLLATAASKDHGVAQPECRVAFTEEPALDAMRNRATRSCRSLRSAPGAACRRRW